MMLYSAKRPMKLWNTEWEDNSFDLFIYLKFCKEKSFIHGKK